ncbi:MAG: ATP-dependent DNA ligase [Gammaproteobacteria bacterium]|jgi:DNA ligase-1|nr:ATP-dependent DNA ligase [Gammaproteobacteria bacterium]
MQRFARLYDRLDGTTSTNARVAAMVDYFRDVPAEDGAWAVWCLTGRRLKRLVPSGMLRQWGAEAAGLPHWLLESSYQHVGDLAETLNLLVPEPERTTDAPPLHRLIERDVRPLARLAEDEKRERVLEAWGELRGTERFLYNKLLTGALRVGVSRRLVTRALAELAGIDSGLMAHRLMGDWQPTPGFFRQLLADEADADLDISRPYPFFLASPLESDPARLGPAEAWRAEWKWDGIRAQLIRRDGQTFLWSRGEERLDGRFPEFEREAESLPDGTVLDGEIMAWRDGPLPFAVLQRRIGRKKVGRKTLETAPTAFLAYDLLEMDGEDQRDAVLDERIRRLQTLFDAHPGQRIFRPESVDFEDWDDLPALRASARERGVEGVMLKAADSPYRVGRKRGDWWKWKVEPYTFDGVLLYAQPGHGRRSGLFTDYTFAVHQADALVPVAKAYSGLTQEEIEELDRWIRAHTTDRFGPVRAVEPLQVFELAFEGITRSPRHKSGIAMRFPRIHRWRRDLSVKDADSLDELERLLPDEAKSP